MEELKHRSHRLSPDTIDRDHLQRVVQNALQTERVCALVKELGGAQAAKGASQGRTERAADCSRAGAALLLSDAGHKSLTPREREVLSLISEGCSNKQGALRMQISPRTFESHRAEAMRKLGARNTSRPRSCGIAAPDRLGSDCDRAGRRNKACIPGATQLRDNLP